MLNSDCIKGVQAKNPVTIYFKPQAWDKMMTYTKLVETEISGLGTVEEIEGKLWITNVFIVEQEASMGHVELDQEALSNLVYEKVKAGDMTFTKKLRLWWHSHNKMNTFHSGTDEDTANHLSGFAPYLISVVTNHKEEYQAWITFSKPTKFTIADVEIEVRDQAVHDQCLDDIKKMVNVKKVEQMRPWEGASTSSGIRITNGWESWNSKIDGFRTQINDLHAKPAGFDNEDDVDKEVELELDKEPESAWPHSETNMDFGDNPSAEELRNFGP